MEDNARTGVGIETSIRHLSPHLLTSHNASGIQWLAVAQDS